jgi:hypothetical protein
VQDLYLWDDSQEKSRLDPDYEQKINRQQAESILRKYTDMKDDDVRATLNKWSCKIVTGIDYSEIKDKFMNGDISAQRAQELLKTFGGVTADEAKKTVDGYVFEKKHGFTESDTKSQYMDGSISKQQLKSALKDEGKTDDEAAAIVSQYDFMKAEPKATDISAEAASDYDTTIKSTGISRKQFYDVWKYHNGSKNDVDKNGKEIYNSAKTKVLKYIDDMPLSTAQKDALYYYLGYSSKTIKEAPWH